MVTIKDIAKELGIAPSTVSMALNERKGISHDLWRKVKESTIGIIGIDDIPIDKVLEPSLSSVKMPIEKMGELGAGNWKVFYFHYENIYIYEMFQFRR